MGRLNRSMTPKERAKVEDALERLDSAIESKDQAELDKAVEFAEAAAFWERPI
jgi:hypothetical protein